MLKRLKGSSVQAWDVEFLMARARADACALPSRELAEYLTLPSILDGFAQLMQRVFGLSFQVRCAKRSRLYGADRREQKGDIGLGWQVGHICGGVRWEECSGVLGVLRACRGFVIVITLWCR